MQVETPVCELARRWLAGKLATSFTTNAVPNHPRLLAILASEFMAFLATIGADPVTTFDECEQQGWIGDFVVVYRLRAVGGDDHPDSALRFPTINNLENSTTTGASLLRTAPQALLAALNGLGVMLGRHRVTVITDRVFGRPVAPLSPLASAIEAAGLSRLEREVAQRLAAMPDGVPVKDWSVYVLNGDVVSAINRLKRKLRPYGFVVYQEKKRTKVKPIVRQAQGAKRGA